MAVPDRTRKEKHGFALIVVLSGLVILTSLFAITSSRSIARLQTISSNSALAENTYVSGELLRLLLTQGHPGTEDASFLEVTMNGHEFVLTLVDVGGLIDLNTATPDLLEILASHMNLPSGALTKFRDWRRTPYRLLRVSDFLRITGAGPEHRDWLQQVATVYSGRHGVSPEDATLPVLELIAGRPGERKTLAQSIPETLQSPASNTNFNVFANVGDSGQQVLIGTIHFGGTPGQNRILWMP